MSLANPQPALKVAVPMNSMVNSWTGDDRFRQVAFRQQNMSCIYERQQQPNQQKRLHFPRAKGHQSSGDECKPRNSE
jgi:predicted acyl esterase